MTIVKVIHHSNTSKAVIEIAEVGMKIEVLHRDLASEYNAKKIINNTSLSLECDVDPVYIDLFEDVVLDILARYFKNTQFSLERSIVINYGFVKVR